MANRKVLVDLDFGGNRIINVTLDALAVDPAVKSARFYYNTTSKVVKFCNGTEWLALATTESTKTISDNVSALANRVTTAEGTITQITASIASLVSSLEALPSTIQNEIKNKLDVEFNSANKTVALLYNGTAFSSFDATSLIKDGMLSNVVLVSNPAGQPAGTYLKFTFNTDAGKSDVYVNVTSLIDIYTGGNGIVISGKSVAVKISQNTEAYLTADSTGLKLTGIDAKITSEVNTAKTAILGAQTQGDKFKTVKALNDGIVALENEMGDPYHGLVKALKVTAVEGKFKNLSFTPSVCVGVTACDKNGVLVDVAASGIGTGTIQVAWNIEATTADPITLFIYLIR